MTPEEQKVVQEAAEILNRIIQSCVHPDIAFRAVFVELDPIRKTLKKIQSILDKSKDE